VVAKVKILVILKEKKEMRENYGKYTNAHENKNSKNLNFWVYNCCF
jgi:hypothetical protein